MQREIIFYILFSLASKTHQKIEFKILLLVHIGCHIDRDWRDVDDDDIWSIQSGRKIGFFPQNFHRCVLSRDADTDDADEVYRISLKPFNTIITTRWINFWLNVSEQTCFSNFWLKKSLPKPDNWILGKKTTENGSRNNERDRVCV